MLSRVGALGIAVLSALASLATPSAIIADESRPAIEYNRDVRPILSEHCFACHGPDGAARKADLRLDKREAAIEAGAIAPGDLEQSELVNRVFTEDREEIMPPPKAKKPL